MLFICYISYATYDMHFMKLLEAYEKTISDSKNQSYNDNDGICVDAIIIGD